VQTLGALEDIRVWRDESSDINMALVGTERKFRRCHGQCHDCLFTNTLFFWCLLIRNGGYTQHWQCLAVS
jgi:hypothetical protein